MRKLRVGVWLQEGYKPTVGGGFGYYSEMIEAIAGYQFEEAEILFLTDNSNLAEINFGNTKVIKINWKPRRHSFFYRIFRIISTKIPLVKRFKEYFKKNEEEDKKVLYDELYNSCDVIYYVIPGCRYPSFPYIYTLWDIGHLSSYAFPELVQNQNFEKRKNHHDYLPHRALMVICESETGKSDAIRYLAINPNRIRVLPLFPSGVVGDEIIAKVPNGFNTWDKFIFYPAQYWAHKNHFGLLQALKLVREEIPDLKLVLTGSDKGNYNYIKDTIKELEIEDSIIDLSFVSLEDMKWLYKNSCGLIMPTLLGPSNMPPLEALYLGCPIAVSDIPGHRELLGDSALYFNPLDFSQIASTIKELVYNPPEIKFKSRSAEYNMPLLDTYFKELRLIRFMWGKE